MSIAICPTNGSATVRNTWTSVSPSGFGATRDLGAALAVRRCRRRRSGCRDRAPTGESAQSRSATRSTPVPVTPEHDEHRHRLAGRDLARERALELARPTARCPSRYASSWASSCDTISSVTLDVEPCSSASASAGSGLVVVMAGVVVHERLLAEHVGDRRGSPAPRRAAARAARGRSPNAARSSPSTPAEVRARPSSCVTTTMRGTPAASAAAHAARVPAVTPSTALTTTSGDIRHRQRRVDAADEVGMPRGVDERDGVLDRRRDPTTSGRASESPRVVPRAISSGSWSQTVVPCSTLPGPGELAGAKQQGLRQGRLARTRAADEGDRPVGRSRCRVHGTSRAGADLSVHRVPVGPGMPEVRGDRPRADRDVPSRTRPCPARRRGIHSTCPPQASFPALCPQVKSQIRAISERDRMSVGGGRIEAWKTPLQVLRRHVEALHAAWAGALPALSAPGGDAQAEIEQMSDDGLVRVGEHARSGAARRRCMSSLASPPRCHGDPGPSSATPASRRRTASTTHRDSSRLPPAALRTRRPGSSQWVGRRRIGRRSVASGCRPGIRTCAAALREGGIALDAASAITAMLDRVAVRVEPARADAVESALVGARVAGAARPPRARGA